MGTVLGNLDKLVPGHPDVVALHAMARRSNVKYKPGKVQARMTRGRRCARWVSRDA